MRKNHVLYLLGQNAKSEALKKLFCLLSKHNEMFRERKLWTDEKIELFDAECKEFLSVFLSVFLTQHVTPYIHCYVFHSSELLYRHRTLYPFIQEPVEKNNHVNLNDFHRSTSKKTYHAMRQLTEKKVRLMLLKDEIAWFEKINLFGNKVLF